MVPIEVSSDIMSSNAISSDMASSDTGSVVVIDDSTEVNTTTKTDGIRNILTNV